MSAACAPAGSDSGYCAATGSGGSAYGGAIEAQPARASVAASAVASAAILAHADKAGTGMIIFFQSIQNVVAAVDIQGAARDGARAVAGEEGAQRAHVLDGGQAAHGRAFDGVGHQAVEMGNAGSGPRLQGPRRDGIDADAFRAP